MSYYLGDVCYCVFLYVFDVIVGQSREVREG